MALAALSPSEEATLTVRGHRILKKLGEGSYAQVFLVEHEPGEPPGRKIQLACKLVDASKAPRDFVRKFLPRELDILVRINHPHIIHIHSIFQRRHKYFIFMRFAERGDLLDYILKYGELNESRARFWCRQLGLAIQYLHEMGIAHRDLKCENVLITEFMNLKIADFGFARAVIDDKGRPLLSATYCGSLSYAAPEILKGMPYDPKISDMWSLGVILFVMLNKSMPYDDTNVKRMYEKQMNKRMKFRSKVVEKLSPQVKNTNFALLEPDIAKRWKIDSLMNSEWFGMDPRLKTMTTQEKNALQQAQQAMATLLEKGAKSSRQQSFRTDGRTGSRVTTQVQSAVNNEAAGYSQVTVIKSNEPTAASSKMDTVSP
ncbi:testis-specific serine/threonine-protein kinase 3-like [Lycorma delicatula]|uniref:testis-specific serine/threonine-protein kinase 3-like n=1 Tax=Lycorma delicatula TaxID=130591 RepID=UPI003F51A18D